MQAKQQILNSIFILFLASLAACNNSEEKIEPFSEIWEKAIIHQEIPEGLASLSAEQCGACHQDHYKEWKLSTHAHAWTDLQFQEEIKKETSPIFCINCHIPLQNQQEYIVSGYINGDIYNPAKKLNPNFDKDLQQEGITCAACHVRNNAVIGPTGTKKAPHATIKNPAYLSEQLCISCHNAVAVITPTLACSFETGDEWKAGPYSKEKNCISCHMDTITRPIVPGYEERTSHLHFFSGSGIPKHSSVETTMLNGLSFNPSTLKKTYAVKDTFKYTLLVKNEFAGHKVPTGDPERFFIILIELKNKVDSTLKSSTFRIGEEWQWHPTAKKLSDNNLLPKEERAFNFSYKFSKNEELFLTVKVTKHRMNKATADYNKLTEEYPLFISIYEKEYTIEVK